MNLLKLVDNAENLIKKPKLCGITVEPTSKRT